MRSPRPGFVDSQSVEGQHWFVVVTRTPRVYRQSVFRHSKTDVFYSNVLLLQNPLKHSGTFLRRSEPLDSSLVSSVTSVRDTSTRQFG